MPVQDRLQLGWSGRSGLSEKSRHGSSVAGRGISLCRGPEVGMSLIHLIHGNEVRVLGALKQAGPVMQGSGGALAQHSGRLVGKELPGAGAR